MLRSAQVGAGASEGTVLPGRQSPDAQTSENSGTPEPGEEMEVAFLLPVQV